MEDTSWEQGAQSTDDSWQKAIPLCANIPECVTRGLLGQTSPSAFRRNWIPTGKILCPKTNLMDIEKILPINRDTAIFIQMFPGERHPRFWTVNLKDPRSRNEGRTPEIRYFARRRFKIFKWVMTKSYSYLNKYSLMWLTIHIGWTLSIRIDSTAMSTLHESDTISEEEPWSSNDYLQGSMHF